jgi:hypothetical protein
MLKEYAMPAAKTMTFDEKFALCMKSIEYEKQGNNEAAMRTMKLIPLPPYLAKIAKEKIGPEFFKNNDWNLSEAEAEFGPGWISR